jgi:hypothetical protein
MSTGEGPLRRRARGLIVGGSAEVEDSGGGGALRGEDGLKASCPKGCITVPLGSKLSCQVWHVGVCFEVTDRR